MIREEIVFGPIKSRRLGSSLGVNLLPTSGKVCNFDCIYCECGWNKDGHCSEKLPTAAMVRRALEDALSGFLLDGTAIDSITFSGDGEPTLNPEFPQIISDTLQLRDIYCPSAKVTVLSNATRLGDPAVFKALTLVDNPIMKIDAPTNEAIALINKPMPGYDLASVVENLRKFNGDFILQTIFIKCSFFDSSEPSQLEAWRNIVRSLRPREIMAYTIARPTPQEGLSKFSVEEIRGFVQPLIDEGFLVQIRG